MKRLLKINAADNVAVAIADDLKKGETLDIDGRPITLLEDIVRGHKVALYDLAEGAVSYTHLTLPTNSA